MKKFLACLTILKLGISEKAISGRPGRFIARLIVSILVPALPAFVIATAGLSVLYVVMLAVMCAAAYVGLYLCWVACSPSLYPLVPVDYRVRLGAVYVFALIFGVIIAVWFGAFLLAVNLLLGGAGAWNLFVSLPAALHPSVWLVFVAMLFGCMGVNAIIHYGTTTPQFAVRAVIFTIIDIVIMASLFYAPAIEQLIMYGSIVGGDIGAEIESVAEVFSYLAHPWAFAGIYAGVYAVLFAAGLAYTFIKGKPSKL